MSGFLPPPPPLSLLSLCLSQPQEGPGSPKPWYYLCAPHLCPPLCRNLAHPTKGNRWCTTVHGMTSVSVGRQLMVNTVADACHALWWRMHKWKRWWCLTLVTGVISRFLSERSDPQSKRGGFVFANAIWGSTQADLISKDMFKYHWQIFF